MSITLIQIIQFKNLTRYYKDCVFIVKIKKSNNFFKSVITIFTCVMGAIYVYNYVLHARSTVARLSQNN